MKNRTIARNYRHIITISIVTVILVVGLIALRVININTLRNFGKEYQYNLLAFSGVLAGFLFTGIGILISTIDKERIKRLWDNNYLDTVYYSAALGIIANILVIVTVFAYFWGNLSGKALDVVLMIQTTLTVLGIVYFIFCMLKLLKVIEIDTMG